MSLCKFCGKECKNVNSLSNHQRLCPQNPERVYVSRTLGKDAWNKGLKNDPRCSMVGKVSGHEHSDETKQRLSRVAKERGFGGYVEGAGRSKKFHVLDSFGNKVCLQSTFEFRVYEILNELSINWIRPKALKYDGRNYFADFYLTDFDIWLDPKNDYKAKQDEEKIRKVIEQNGIRLYVILENQITKQFIASLV